MVNPMKDIVIGTGLGVSLALVWKNYKKTYFERVDSYYKWYDAEQAKKLFSIQSGMKLYVHYEDGTSAWTKRLTVENLTTTLEEVLTRFSSAYRAKFTRDLSLTSCRVFVERNQDTLTRKLITTDKYKQRLDQFSGINDTSAIEFVIVAAAPAKAHKEGELPAKKQPVHCHMKAPPSNELRVLDSDVKDGLEIAASQIAAKQYVLAKDTYEMLVFPSDPKNPEASLAMGTMYLTIDKPKAAVDKYLLPCWEGHREHSRDKASERVVFNVAIKLVECLISQHRYKKALSVLDQAQQYVRQRARHRGWFSDMAEKDRAEARMDYLRANALYDLKTQTDQETAISLLLHLLPDLQAADVNLDALQLYARIAQDRGKKNEAVSMLFRVLVGKSKDKTVRKQLVDLLRGKKGMERLVQAIPVTDQSAAVAYAYVATILKDFGAIDVAVLCFRQALQIVPTSATYALNLAHALEACNRYEEAYNALVRFFQSNRGLSVGGVANAGEVVDALARNGWKFQSSDSAEFSRWKLIWKPTSGQQGRVDVYENGSLCQKQRKNAFPTRASLTEDELDLLATFFAVVKILFLNGRLAALPRLIGLLEPIRAGRELHTTMIRNEQAYYVCIAQLLCISPFLKQPNVPDSHRLVHATAERNAHTYVCGDSHTLATAWREIQLQGSPVILQPALVTGLKHWHLRPESQFYPKINFWNVLEALPRHSRVIFLLGEIDCREGILRAVQMCKYETVEEGMKHTASIFMEAVTEVVKRFGLEVFIHPIVPVLKETRHLVIQYNQILRDRVNKSNNSTWLDFFDDLLEGSPAKLRSCYELDGTHLHPSYLQVLERELSKHVQ
ncbi:hypothetical protein Poli38472_000298 [Pythium oligandrum]|uniref:Uncharacterized protein n=1 Tax=Pythium oligandrum TaxID=41045 RepID=A0A8K1FF76_PYTOL|nr:hypothetical protein Poli38472_000298 [Pythium oligandrum]|eukprot:TMW60256.1 hypothetical protein Poli38472_000298 [Pythium oligandrum]